MHNFFSATTAMFQSTTSDNLGFNKHKCCLASDIVSYPTDGGISIGHLVSAGNFVIIPSFYFGMGTDQVHTKPLRGQDSHLRLLIYGQVPCLHANVEQKITTLQVSPVKSQGCKMTVWTRTPPQAQIKNIFVFLLTDFSKQF